jgi:hypothetical protein
MDNRFLQPDTTLGNPTWDFTNLTNVYITKTLYRLSISDILISEISDILISEMDSLYSHF